MSAGKTLIFGGTSEGRELAEYASRHQVPVLVSVVSEYGESLLEENACVRVRQGALDADAMKALLQKEAPELVLDATHPYARLVTGQARELCRQLEIPYRRVVREETGQKSNVFSVPSPEAAVELLKEDREPVLLTTGSKELEMFAAAEHLAGRIFARVLPTSEVLKKCEDLGLNGSHLIAMQGPFSEEMNCAILHQTGAKWLVTKESGSRGGFMEKVSAAQNCGCRVVVIERPVKEQGISLAEAKELLRQMQACGPEPEKRNIFLIGMGMGGGGQLTQEAADVLGTCDAVLGAPRMLEDVGPWCTRAKKEPRYLAEQILDWLEAHPGYRNVGVVYSGDTGFYSGSRSLTELLKNRCGEPCGWQIQVYPGVSSVSSLCARMQTSWEDMYLASAHGRNCDVVELIRRHPRLFLLLGGAENLGSVCGKLKEAGYGAVRVTAGVHMGYPDERLIRGTAAELAGIRAEELTAVVLERMAEDREKNEENRRMNHER